MAVNMQTVLMTKRFDAPDEVRAFTDDKGRIELVEVGGRMIGRGTYMPGWKWSENAKPIFQTDSCEMFHLGYCESGSMRVTMDSGESIEFGPGDVCEIPPHHDAEVLGDEPCVLMDFGQVASP